MTVHVLLREDQNDHGFIDTSITGVFASQAAAMSCLVKARTRAHADGLRICDQEEPDWQVYWKIEDHEVEENQAAAHVSTYLNHFS